jgi:hypothetical protein
VLRPILFVLLLHGLGSCAALCALRGRHLLYAVSSGLAWGLALHVFLGLPLVLASYAAGSYPLYRIGVAGAVDAGAALAAVIVVAANARRWGLTLRRLLVVQGVAIAGLAACTAAAMTWNFSAMSPDSFAYVEHGLALARIHDARQVSLDFVREISIFGVLVHAASGLAGVEYLHFLAPVVTASLLATLAAATAGGILRLARPPWVAAAATILGLTWLMTGYLVVFQVFYVHVNWLAAVYLLLFFHALWMALDTRLERWFEPAAAAAFAFALVRVEGALFLALFVGLLALETGVDERRRPWWVAALALPAATWCSISAVLGGEGGRIVDRTLLLAMAAALVATVALAWAMRSDRIRRHASALQSYGLVGLAGIVAGMIVARPEHMLSHLRILIVNAFLAGGWATTWGLAAALGLAAPLLGRLPQQRFLGLSIAGYLGGIVAMTYFGSWRPGWFDSGNRMLVHILPTVAWVLMLKSALIALPQRTHPSREAG